MDSLVVQLTSRDFRPLPSFVNLPERLKCTKCGSALRGPIQTQCGHRICNPCFCALMREGVVAQCPGGEEDCVEITPDTVNPDMCAKRESERLLVYCPFTQYGCRETVRWGDLDKHESECQFAVETCPNEGCGEAIPKVDIGRHVEGECKYTPVACPECGLTVGQGFKEQHLREDCEAVDIVCPYKCGEQSLKRRELAEHKEHCKCKPKECTFKSMGCTFEGSISDVQRHLVNHTADHLALVSNHSVELSQTIDNLNMDLHEVTSVMDELTNNMAQQREAIVAQNNTLGRQSTKVSSLEATLLKKEQAIAEVQREARLVKEKVEQNQKNHDTSVRVVQETQLRHDRRLGDVERMRLVDNPQFTGDSNVRAKLARQDAQIAMVDIRMAEMDLRFQCLETANYSGVLIWKICDFARRKREAATGQTISLYSQPFYTNRHGYKMCARIYLNGDGLGKGTHISLFFVVMKGDYDSLLQWPFQKRVTLTLLDQRGGRSHISDTFRPDPTSSSFQKPVNEMNIASGCPLFVEQSLAEGPPYVVEDTVFFKVAVDD